jgi:GNAT superfamily N-acetyltransferase
MAHGEAYAREFGWDTSMEAFTARIVAEYARSHDPNREAAWIAELDSQRVGCVFCVAADDMTAQLRLLLVDSAARGRGLGGRLVDECLAFARKAGYRRMMLWTNHPLQAARLVYLSRGFELVREEPHHSFGVDLVGQTYELDLVGGGGAQAPGESGAGRRLRHSVLGRCQQHGARAHRHERQDPQGAEGTGRNRF